MGKRSQRPRNYDRVHGSGQLADPHVLGDGGAVSDRHRHPKGLAHKVHVGGQQLHFVHGDAVEGGWKGKAVK